MEEMNNEYQKAAHSFQEQLKKAKKSGRAQGALIASVIAIFIALIIVAGIFITKLVNGSFFSMLNTSSDSVITSDVRDKADAIKAVIDTYYLDEIDSEDLADGIYKGLVDGLGDPYSEYYTPEEYKELISGSEGIYYGIGAYLQQDMDTMYIKVVRPIKDSPAEKVGLKAEDIIVEVDGENIQGQDINLVVSKIRGKAGTVVNIGVVRAGETDYLYFDITRWNRRRLHMRCLTMKSDTLCCRNSTMSAQNSLLMPWKI